jgi:hypothetical protein
MHERVLGDAGGTLEMGYSPLLAPVICHNIFPYKITTIYPHLCVCLCVCVCFLLWPCTLRLWAVTMRQLNTSCFTSLPPIQKPTMRTAHLLPNAMLNQGNKKKSYLCKGCGRCGSAALPASASKSAT